MTRPSSHSTLSSPPLRSPFDRELLIFQLALPQIFFYSFIPGTPRGMEPMLRPIPSRAVSALGRAREHTAVHSTGGQTRCTPRCHTMSMFLLSTYVGRRGMLHPGEAEHGYVVGSCSLSRTHLSLSVLPDAPTLLHIERCLALAATPTAAQYDSHDAVLEAGRRTRAGEGVSTYHVTLRRGQRARLRRSLTSLHRRHACSF